MTCSWTEPRPSTCATVTCTPARQRRRRIGRRSGQNWMPSPGSPTSAPRDYHLVRLDMLAAMGLPASAEKLPPDTMEILAELEHIRWCRYHYLNNWTFGQPGGRQAKGSCPADSRGSGALSKPHGSGARKGPGEHPHSPVSRGKPAVNAASVSASFPNIHLATDQRLITVHIGRYPYETCCLYQLSS